MEVQYILFFLSCYFGICKQVKKSGLMGSGLGFTIGKEKRNDQHQEADTLQKASTVGSLQGNVSISSHHGTHVIASDILAGKILHAKNTSL